MALAKARAGHSRPRASDREDGEISSDEEAQNKSAPLMPTSRADMTPTINPSPTHTISTPPIASARPLPSDHRPISEQAENGGYRPAETPKPLALPSRHLQRKNKKYKNNNRVSDVNPIVAEVDADFTTLIAEYQQARTSSLPQSEPTSSASSTSPAPPGDFDIPGLGQHRHKAHSNSPAPLDKQKRLPPPHRRHSPAQFANMKSAAHQHIPQSVTAQLRNQFQQPPLPSNESYSSQQENLMAAFGHFSAVGNFNDYTQQNSSESQMFSLVHELLDHGVPPEYLVNTGIDSAVVNYVCGQRTNPTTAALADLIARQSGGYPDVAFAQPQQQQPQLEYPIHDTMGRAQNEWAPFHQSLPDQRNGHQQQQHPEAHGPSMLSSSDFGDAAAMKQLEMIMAYASQVLPAGWDSLLQQRGPDNSNDAVAIGASGNARESGWEGNASTGQFENDMARPPRGPRSELMARGMGRAGQGEQMNNRRSSPMRSIDSDGPPAGHPKGHWNDRTEPKYTTNKFRDLSISPRDTSVQLTGDRHHARSNNGSQPTSTVSERPPSPPPAAPRPPPPPAAPQPPPPPSSPLLPTPPPPPPPPAPTRASPSPLSPSKHSISSEQLTASPSQTSESDQYPPLDPSQSADLSINQASAIEQETVDLIHQETVPAEESLVAVDMEEDTASSQDEMDMEIDEGFTQPTILKGTWKTTSDRPPAVSQPPSQPPPKPISRPSRPDANSDPQVLEVHSVSARTTSTPPRSVGSPMIQTLQRTQRPKRRATAMDFITRSQPQTPFIQERSRSYVIDLDDDDDDDDDNDGSSDVTDRARDLRLTNSRTLDRTNTPPEPMSLAAIQKQLEKLNNLIKEKERAKLANPSTPKRVLTAAAATATLSQPVTPTPVASPDSGSNAEDQSTTAVLRTEEIEKRRQSLSEHTMALDDLRKQLRECEQETAVASNSLDTMASAGMGRQVEGLLKTIEEAKEKVAQKERELEDARRHLQESEARLVPMLSQGSNVVKSKDRLRMRVKAGQEKSASLKASIDELDREVIRKRTELLLLEAASMSRTAVASHKINTPPIASTFTPPLPANSTEDLGPKRGVDSQGQQSPMPVTKKPRTQREEMSVLTKRMQELARERELLRSGVPSVTNNSPSSTPPTETKSSRPSPSVAVSSSSNTPPQQFRNSTDLAQPRPQLPLQKPTATLAWKTASGVQTAPSFKSPPPQKNLAKLDDFLATARSLPINPVVINTSESSSSSSLSSWKQSGGINKLFSVDACLFELDHLCLPSELIQYAIPIQQNGMQVDPLAKNGPNTTTILSADSSSSSSSSALDYTSPLTMFRSYRFSPQYKEQAREGYHSLTYSNKIDPMQPMCIYELSGGSCNDDACKSQHLRNVKLTDEELVIDMARYSEGSGPQTRQVFSRAMSAKLEHLRASGIHNTDLLLDTIVKGHRDFVHDASRIVKFDDRIKAGSASSRVGVSGRSIDRILVSSKGGANLLDASPIIMADLAKALGGTSMKTKRYHDYKSSDDYEKLLQSTPADETLWIEYAISQLSDTTESNDEERMMHNSMAVLSRALVAYPGSEILWSLYMDLYIRNGAELETHTMFEHALQHVPDAQLLYYSWEKGRDERVYVLDQMLERACQEPREADDKPTRSRFVLDVVLQIVKTMVSENCVESSKNWLQNFLTCSSWDFVVPSTLSYAQLDDVWREQDMVENISGTLAAKLLTPTDLCILWLAFVYLIWYHELPAQLFMDHPNSYLTDSHLFTIRWEEIKEPEQEDELHDIVHEIFLGLTFYFVDCEAGQALVATLKNFVGFLQARGQKQEEILELVNPSQFPGSVPEIWDLFCQVQMHFNREEEAKKDLQKAIQDSPNQPYLWNRYARLLPDEGKATCLEQCALEFFTIQPSHLAGLGRSELSLLLYRKLLGLDLPYSFMPPSARLDIAPFKTNMFLWLNYLSLLALGFRQTNSFEQLESAFAIAMDSLPTNSVSFVQTDFAVHSIMKELDKPLLSGAFHNTVAAAVSKIAVSIPNPYDHGRSEETKVSRLHDFTQLNRVVECLRNRTVQGSQDLRVHLLDSFLRLYPDNPDLFLWMGEAEEAAGHTEQCRKILDDENLSSIPVKGKHGHDNKGELALSSRGETQQDGNPILRTPPKIFNSSEMITELGNDTTMTTTGKQARRGVHGQDSGSDVEMDN
ncbi:Zinc finger C3H1 domain-containing protein [Dissophora globulifera]|nr:Zinc finger C3H1 domain-containing protein [Dissophora globulifera]